MIEKSKNKMITAPEVSKRDAFIIEKAKKGFSPTETLTLLKREGFQPVARSRIYQILERHGIKPKA